MFGLNETTDRLAIANSVHWHGHMLGREDNHDKGLRLKVTKKQAKNYMEEVGG